MQIVVLHNQSLLDVCLQHTGSIESVFELAMANDLAITDDVQAGQILELPEGIAMDKDILNYYKAKNIQPATKIQEQTTNNEPNSDGVFPLVLPEVL